MSAFASRGQHGFLLEAEVARARRPSFEQRYLAATQHSVTPGTPVHYQAQDNKWGAELRVYFNDPGTAVALAANGFHVENALRAYQSQNYSFRVNSAKLWWELVENHGFELGSN